MNRTELQLLSDERLDDARELLFAQRWSGAYYLSGYALECALKACVLLYIERTGVIFKDRKYAEKCWTHDLETLVRQAALDVPRAAAIAANPMLGTNWLIARDWSEESRYHFFSSTEAKNLYDAVSDPLNGVRQWLMNHW